VVASLRVHEPVTTIPENGSNITVSRLICMEMIGMVILHGADVATIYCRHWR
jgi:hypothetical protein